MSGAGSCQELDPEPAGKKASHTSLHGVALAIARQMGAFTPHQEAQLHAASYATRIETPVTPGDTDVHGAMPSHIDDLAESAQTLRCCLQAPAPFSFKMSCLADCRSDTLDLSSMENV